MSNGVESIIRRVKPTFMIEGKISRKEAGWILLESLDPEATVNENYTAKETNSRGQLIEVEKTRQVTYRPWTELICFRKDGQASKELKEGDILECYVEISHDLDKSNRVINRYWLVDYVLNNQPQEQVKPYRRK